MYHERLISLDRIVQARRMDQMRTTLWDPAILAAVFQDINTASQ